MLNILRREAIYLWYYFDIQFRQIFGYWVLGIVIGSVISVFAKDKIHGLFAKMNGKKWGVFGVIPASLLGIASPLCMYGTIPIAASFANQGMRQDWLAALAVRIISCFLCGAAAGLLVCFFYRDKPFFSFGKFEEPVSHDTDPNMVLRLLKNIWRNIKATGPYFLIGVVLSAVFQRYVPTDAFVSLFGSNKGFGVLMAATIGVPLYACGGGTIPLLLEWLADGMSLGNAAAFMITGPATKITNLGALKSVLGIKRFCLYLLFVMGFAFVTGLTVNLL